MSERVTLRLLVGASILTVWMAGLAQAKTPCDQLVGKQITLHGRILSAEPLMLGGYGVDTVVIESSEPSCGKIQTNIKLRSCRAGNPYSGKGRLVNEISTRSGGSTRPDAADYAFRPDDADACR
jgi:hypothetical protein